MQYHLKRPRLNLLRTFSAAARHLSFSLAAGELNISQSAVSQQIRQLEAYLEVPLFIRHHRRLSLTNTGQLYFETVFETLNRLDSVTDQLFPAKGKKRVSLHCSSVVATLWLAPQLKRFHQQNTDVELRITTIDQLNQNAAFPSSDLEIFIPRQDAIESQASLLLTSTIVPICSPQLLADGPWSDPAQLLEQELIHVLGYQHGWQQWFRKYQPGNDRVPGGLSVDGSLIAIEATQRGEGVMLGRRPFIDRYLESGDLVEAFAQPFPLYADYYLRQRPGETQMVGRQQVVDWLHTLAIG